MNAPAAKPARRAIAVVGGLILLAGPAYCAHTFATAETRVRQACDLIEPGMPLAELQAFASSHGLGPPPHEGISYMVERKSFGRHGCKVTVAQGVVASTEYTFAD
jgi:hypothetical protein